KPKQRLSVQDVAAILRSHLDDTEYDYRRENPAGSPHHPEEIIDWTFARTACNIGTQESAIFHLRSWLPKEIGCLVWRATSVPCTSVYTPWYSSMSETPAEFYTPCSVQEQLSLEHHFNPDPAEMEINDRHAFWPFYRLTWLVDADYARLAPAVKERWQAVEAKEFAAQPDVEAKALEMMKENRDHAVCYLTSYCREKALAAVQAAREMVAGVRPLVNTSAAWLRDYNETLHHM
ncbi:MAG: C69 family dipeptidase, partial [Bacillota bacterium]